jgi:hypothetical protein
MNGSMQRVIINSCQQRNKFKCYPRLKIREYIIIIKPRQGRVKG